MSKGMAAKRLMLHGLEWEAVVYWYPVYGPGTGRHYSVTCRPLGLDDGVCMLQGQGDTEKQAFDQLKRMMRRVLRASPADVKRLRLISHHDYNMRRLGNRAERRTRPHQPRPKVDPCTGLAIEYAGGSVRLPRAKPGTATKALYNETDRQLRAGWFWESCPHCNRNVLVATERRTRERCACGARRVHSAQQTGWAKGDTTWWSC